MDDAATQPLPRGGRPGLQVPHPRPKQGRKTRIPLGLRRGLGLAAGRCLCASVSSLLGGLGLVRAPLTMARRAFTVRLRPPRPVPAPPRPGTRVRRWQTRIARAGHHQQPDGMRLGGDVGGQEDAQVGAQGRRCGRAGRLQPAGGDGVRQRHVRLRRHEVARSTSGARERNCRQSRGPFCGPRLAPRPPTRCRSRYAHFREKELETSVNPTYMSRQAHINEKMRAILIDWLVEVRVPPPAVGARNPDARRRSSPGDVRAAPRGRWPARGSGATRRDWYRAFERVAFAGPPQVQAGAGDALPDGEPH